MRDEKEERKKQARLNKQGKVTQHAQGSHLFLRKNELPRVGLEPTTLYTLDRATCNYMYCIILYMSNVVERLFDIIDYNNNTQVAAK